MAIEIQAGLEERQAQAHDLREELALSQLHEHQRHLGAITIGSTPLPPVTNGDEELFPDDRRATYHKGLKQSGGFVDPASFATFRAELGPASGGVPGTIDFSSISPYGKGRRQNGPRGAYAFALAGADPWRFGVKPAYRFASKEYAVELVELYWASLLRDVAFADYATNPIAAAAMTELSALSTWYDGPIAAGAVTPQLLFRGKLPGETVGPYLSQFLVQSPNLGALAFSAKCATFAPGSDFMTTFAEWDADSGRHSGVLARRARFSCIYTR